MDISEQDLQILSETGNIGLGHATTALSNMMNQKRVGLGLPATLTIPISNIEEKYGVVGMCSAASHKVSGDMSGIAMLAIQHDHVLTLVDLVMNQAIGTTKELNNENMGVVTEVSNIIMGAYLNAIAKMLGDVRILPEPPTGQNGQLSTIITDALKILPDAPSQIISVQTDFSIDECPIKGYMFLLFDQASVGSFLTLVKKKYGM